MQHYKSNKNLIWKGRGNTEELSKALMEELNCETAFTIPIFGGIPVAESVVITWIIMAVLVIGSIILVRGLRVDNVGKKQLVHEQNHHLVYSHK